jgi:hypothetical protein
MPSRFLRIFFFSVWWRAWAFFVMPSITPSVSSWSSSCRRWRRLRIVSKFVSVPPSHRSVTKGWFVRTAVLRTASRAARLVPTQRILPPSEATCFR